MRAAIGATVAATTGAGAGAIGAFALFAANSCLNAKTPPAATMTSNTAGMRSRRRIGVLAGIDSIISIAP
jgi:hypothetical protein